MKYLVFVLSVLTVNAGLAADESIGNFGSKKAATAFDKEQGFQLSNKAVQNLDIRFQNLQGKGPWKVSTSSIVNLKQSIGVYRRAEEWITLVLVRVVQRTDTDVYILSEDLQSGDDVANHGVSFLRMTDADLNSGTVDNCAH